MKRFAIPSRRGFVLVAVMVSVGMALFIATTFIYVVDSNASSAAAGTEAVQSRALAWSGLQVLMSELNDQREIILEGESPELDDEYVLFEHGSLAGVIRLLPHGPHDELLVAEAGKLDINEIDAEALKRTGMIDPMVAEAIITYRDGLGRPLQSVEELLNADGVTPHVFYGPLEEFEFAGVDQLEGVFTPSVGSGNLPARGLVDILTVFAIEPLLQRNGKLRISLNVEWSEELGDRIEDRFDRGARDGVKGLFESGYRFDSQDKLYEVMNQFRMPPEQWVEPIDALTASPHDYASGRLDLNAAPYEALLGLPGVTPDQATAIISARSGLSADERATSVWPAMLGILEPATYNELGSRVTNRSWTYRIRIAAGTVDIDDPDQRLSRPIVYEAVMDLSEPRARVAYLRDISLLDTAVNIALNADLGRDQSNEASTELESTSDTVGMADDEESAVRTDETSSDDDEGGLDFGGDLSRDSANPGDEDRSGTGNETSADGGGATQPLPRHVGRWRRGDG